MQHITKFVRGTFRRNETGGIALEYLFIAFVVVALSIVLVQAIKNGTLATLIADVIVQIIKHFLTLFLGL